MCVVAAGSFLFETRLGCLDERVPERTRRFTAALQDMLTSSLYVIVGERLHQKLNTPFWRRHADSWNRLFAIGQPQSLDISDTQADPAPANHAGEGIRLLFSLPNAMQPTISSPSPLYPHSVSPPSALPFLRPTRVRSSSAYPLPSLPCPYDPRNHGWKDAISFPAGAGLSGARTPNVFSACETANKSYFAN